MAGWGTGLKQTSGDTSRCRGWGSPIEDDLIIGQSRYELGVFAEGRLQKIFRTDVGDVVSLVEMEARRYIQQQEQENPTAKYLLKKLQWADC